MADVVDIVVCLPAIDWHITFSLHVMIRKCTVIADADDDDADDSADAAVVVAASILVIMFLLQLTVPVYS